ncbi:MAG: ABC transporter ATP-binding protein [Pseudomonadota bacterium]
MSIGVDALTKQFGDFTAVNAVSFDIPDSAFFCVVGPSGCGKSTLLRLIAGLEAPDSGTVTLDDQVVAGPGAVLPPEERRVGVVFQSYALWPHLSVAGNVAFPYEARGEAKAEAHRKAAAHLATVSLSDLADRRPEALSGGQRQRVALARCLAGDARTILMDEPLANLDPHLRSAMEAELRAFHDASGVTTLFITHDQREAMALADIMAVMEAGEILQIGPPEEIYERPRTAQVARFIGRGALIPAAVQGGTAQLVDQAVPIEGAGSGQQMIFIRPKSVHLDPDGFPATLRAVQYRGGHWEARAVAQGIEEEIVLDLPRPAKPGDILHLRISGGWALPEPG